MVLGGNVPDWADTGIKARRFVFGYAVQRYPLSKPRTTVRVVTTAGFLLHLASGPMWPLVDPKMVSL